MGPAFSCSLITGVNWFTTDTNIHDVEQGVGGRIKNIDYDNVGVSFSGGGESVVLVLTVGRHLC